MRPFWTRTPGRGGRGTRRIPRASAAGSRIPQPTEPRVWALEPLAWHWSHWLQRVPSPQIVGGLSVVAGALGAIGWARGPSGGGPAFWGYNPVFV